MAPKKKPSPKQLAARAKFAAMARARAAAAKKKKSTTGATKKTTSKKTTSSKIGISYYGDGKPVMARDLKIGQKYEWIMGAEYLEVKYIGPTSKHKTKKPGSKIGTGGYLFQFVKGGGYADMGSSAIFQYLRTIPAKITGATSRKKPATTSRKKPATTSRHTDTKSHNVKISVMSGNPIFEYKVSRGGKYYVTSNIPMQGIGITQIGDGSDHKRNLKTYLFTELALKKMQKTLGKENTTYIETDY